MDALFKAKVRRRATRWVIVGSLILILAATGGIAALNLFSPSAFHQQITTGPHITSIQVGTDLNTLTETIQGETDTFHSSGGSALVCLGFTVSGDPSAVDVYLIYDSHSTSHSTFLGYRSAFCTELLGIGIYEWQVDYNGTPEATITFQVLS